MTISLPKDLEQFVDDAVRTGRYARKGDVIRDALTRLKQAMPEEAAATERRTGQTKPARPKEPRSKEAFHRRLIEMGLMSRTPRHRRRLRGSGRPTDRHPGRAPLRDHHPRAPLRWISSSIPRRR